jgi:hypothetical protein
MNMNMMGNLSSCVENTIRLLNYCIAVVSKFLLYEIHSYCHCVYVTVRTTVAHISPVIPCNEISNKFGQDSLL